MLKGKKVTHRYFMPDEWVTMPDANTIHYNDGVTGTSKTFWQVRSHAEWQFDWSLWESAKASSEVRYTVEPEGSGWTIKDNHLKVGHRHILYANKELDAWTAANSMNGRILHVSVERLDDIITKLDSYAEANSSDCGLPREGYHVEAMRKIILDELSANK